MGFFVTHLGEVRKAIAEAIKLADGGAKAGLIDAEIVKARDKVKKFLDEEFREGNILKQIYIQVEEFESFLRSQVKPGLTRALERTSMEQKMDEVNEAGQFLSRAEEVLASIAQMAVQFARFERVLK